MSLHHAAPGEVIDLQPFGEKLPWADSVALVRTDEFEVMRLVLQEGKSVPQHHVPGDLSLQCLEGTVEVQAGASPLMLQPGQMVFIAGNTPYALRALEHSSLLMTMVRKPKDE
jgi:quercetin dioxygenase-like cupin family protein